MGLFVSVPTSRQFYRLCMRLLRFSGEIALYTKSFLYTIRKFIYNILFPLLRESSRESSDTLAGSCELKLKCRAGWVCRGHNSRLRCGMKLTGAGLTLRASGNMLWRSQRQRFATECREHHRGSGDAEISSTAHFPVAFFA